jgi:hypothetical protein
VTSEQPLPPVGSIERIFWEPQGSIAVCRACGTVQEGTAAATLAHHARCPVVALVSTIAHWSPRDRAVLVEVVRLGPPTAIDDGTAWPAREPEKGVDRGEPWQRPPEGPRERLLAELLRVYRAASERLPREQRMPVLGRRA